MGSRRSLLRAVVQLVVCLYPLAHSLLLLLLLYSLLCRALPPFPFPPSSFLLGRRPLSLHCSAEWAQLSYVTHVLGKWGRLRGGGPSCSFFWDFFSHVLSL